MQIFYPYLKLSQELDHLPAVSAEFCVEFKKLYNPIRPGVNENIDWLTFRDNIWSISGSLSALLEPANRKLVPIFFDFIDNEYTKELRFQDLRPTESLVKDENSGKISRQKTKKMLINCLTLFANFKNQTGLFREPELKEFCIDLLQSPDAQLQKAAISYLGAYKKEFVARYKNIFDDLVNDDAFKTTFNKVMLKEDGGSDEVIKPHDEDQVLEFTLRIAFGKMISKISASTAGKDSAVNRQKFIIKYLADSKLSHLKLFYNLATECTQYLKVDDHKNAITNCWPLGKQLGTLQTLHTIIKSVNWLNKGEGLLDIRSDMVKAVIKFGVHADFVLSKKDALKPAAIRQMKDIRGMAILALKTFSESSGHKFDQERIIIEKNIFNFVYASFNLNHTISESVFKGVP